MVRQLRRFKIGLWVILLGVGLFEIALIAQSVTVTSTYPTMPQNVTQWGGNTLTAGATLSDALGNPTAPFIASFGVLWDTTAWVRQRAAVLATTTPASTLTSRNLSGVQLVEKSGRWAGFSNPAASSQATYTIAAEGAVRHVADCVSFSAASTTAPALTALTVQLRDGASGAGTVLQQWQVVIEASTGQNVAPFGICGLNLAGTTNTAMTLEFSALLTNLLQSVSLTGYNVN